jgi:signal transduction histidine kinase
VATTICDEIRASGQMVVIDHVDADPHFCSHHTPAQYGFQSYISVPIVLADGTFFGTLCAIDPKPAVVNTPATVHMFTLFAELIAFHLDAFARVAHLEGVIAERTAALRDLNTALQREMATTQAERQALRALTERLECLREEQRTAIARELHDEFGQSLTALKLDVTAMRKLFQDRGVAATDGLLARVSRMENVVELAFDAVERIVADLRPTVLDVLGCIPAAEWLLAQFEDRTGIRARLDADRALDLAPDVGTALFRILQETLTNISRHANASHVDVMLRPDGDDLVLRVADDGRGLTAADRLNPGAFGLRGIAERARALHGTLCLGKSASGGLAVMVRFPAVGAVR